MRCGGVKQVVARTGARVKRHVEWLGQWSDILSSALIYTLSLLSAPVRLDHRDRQEYRAVVYSKHHIKHNVQEIAGYRTVTSVHVKQKSV